jgi:hypothetical protein
MLIFDVLLGKVLEGLTKGILDIAGDRRRANIGTQEFFKQQDYLATIRQGEDQHRFEQETARQSLSEARADQRSAEAHQRAMQMEQLRSVVSIETQLVVAEARRSIENSPFFHSPAETRKRVATMVADGRPALLFAPFYDEDRADAVNGFGVAMNHTWDQLSWRDSLVRLSGLFRRPLHQSDVDLMAIRETLHGLPIVLIHGDVQAGRRVWTSMQGWGLTPGLTPSAGDQLIKVDLPNLELPDATSDPAARLEFQDELARVCGTVAGVLGDWYHLFSTGRAPRVHLDCVDDEVRRKVGAAVAGAYEAASARGRMERVHAGLGQARVLAESGLVEEAVEVTTDLPPDRIKRDGGLREEFAQVSKIVHPTGDGGTGTVADTLEAMRLDRLARFWTD